MRLCEGDRAAILVLDALVTRGKHLVALFAESLNLTAPRWCKALGDPPSRNLNLEIDFFRLDRLVNPQKSREEK